MIGAWERGFWESRELIREERFLPLPHHQGSYRWRICFSSDLSRQVALERQMDVVSNNIANPNTTGYKSRTVRCSREYVGAGARDGGFSGQGQLRRWSASLSTADVWHDMGQGGMQNTGNPLDVAIDGEGFFSIQTPEGERYTRNGAFQINGQGQLVNVAGQTVIGENGPIVFQPGDRNIIISKDGRVTVNEGGGVRTEGTRGKLRIAKSRSGRGIWSRKAAAISARRQASHRSPRPASTCTRPQSKSPTSTASSPCRR